MSEWTKELETQIIALRGKGHTYKAIAAQVGKTENSIKHKVRRLQQGDNQDRYKHTAEKIAQAVKFIDKPKNILETHCGFGGMTDFYAKYGEVESYDIDQKRVNEVSAKGYENVTAIKADSEREVLRLLSHRCTYDIVDIDPYGLPSRYFPYVFGLIHDGVMFLTFPMMGVAQINKITIRHYQAFWGIELSDKAEYLDKIVAKLKDYAFMHKREIEVLEIVKLDRVYRFAIRVKQKSLLDIVGLTVNRKK